MNWRDTLPLGSANASEQRKAWAEVERLKAEKTQRASCASPSCDRCGDPAGQGETLCFDCVEPLRLALTEIKGLHTWKGLMSLVDEHYPADLVDGSSGDPGPRLVVMLRELDKAKAEVKRLQEDPFEAAARCQARQRRIAELEAEVKRLQECLLKLRLRLLGTRTPHPAQHEARALWDKVEQLVERPKGKSAMSREKVELPEWLKQIAESVVKSDDWPDGKSPAVAFEARAVACADDEDDPTVSLLQMVINEVERLVRVLACIDDDESSDSPLQIKPDRL